MAISSESREKLDKLYPWVFNDLKFIENPKLEKKIVAAIAKAIELGEAKFDQKFGGWYPNSNEFGITTLRPHHIDNPTSSDNRWIWTSGSTATLDWAAEDTYKSMTLDDDEIIVLYGYFNFEAKPNTIELKIEPGIMKLPLITVQPMRAKNEQYIIFPEPIVLEPRSPLVIKASCVNTSTAEECGFLGYFIAPASTLQEKT